jgi:mevalonate pyrophosphate decarboxylase
VGWCGGTGEGFVAFTCDTGSEASVHTNRTARGGIKNELEERTKEMEDRERKRQKRMREKVEKVK